MIMIQSSLIAFLALFCEKVSSFSTIGKMTPPFFDVSTSSLRALHSDDSAEYASPLKLTIDDMERFQSLQTRQKTMPILILESMLPKQNLSFESSDPKIVRLMQYCFENDCDVGMLGINPNTGEPLTRGVTFSIHDDSIRILPDKKSVVLTVKADRRMEIQSRPSCHSSFSLGSCRQKLLLHSAPLLGCTSF